MRKEGKRKKNAKILASKIVPLRDLYFEKKDSIHFLMETSKVTRNRLEELRDILLDYHGSCTAFLHIMDDDKGETIMKMGGEFSVKPCSELVKQVEDLLGQKAVWLH